MPLRLEQFGGPYARNKPVHLHCSSFWDVGGCHILGAKRQSFTAGGSPLIAAVPTAKYGSPDRTKSPGNTERAGATALGHHHRRKGCTWRAWPRRSHPA